MDPKDRWDMRVAAHLPTYVAWPLLSVLLIVGWTAGTIAMDLWGYVLTWRRNRSSSGR